MAAIAALALLIAGCSTPYQSEGITGGYSDTELEPGIERVVYGGNGFTTRETVQTYWLYNAAEVTLEKGFDGFQILSDIRFVGIPVKVAAAGPIFIPMPGYESDKPIIEGDIRLLKKPFEPAPPKIFDAAKLKAALEPYVTGHKCSRGNVCPHVHRYLFPNSEK